MLRLTRTRWIPSHIVEWVGKADAILREHGDVAGAATYEKRHQARWRAQKLIRLLVELRVRERWELIERTRPRAVGSAGASSFPGGNRVATDNQQPTVQDWQAGQDVAAAAIAAARAEPEPAKRKPAARRAIQEEAAARGWELSDDDAGRLANVIVDLIRDAVGLEQQPVADAAVIAPAPAVPAPAAARPPSFAERFRSGG